jgi:POT family proton-dependent oligopeptide transporter
MSSAVGSAGAPGAAPVTMPGVHSSKTILGHPAGLFVLFATEMWERFSFYGMRALLVLYMTQYLIGAVESGTYVFGFGAIRSLLESVSGPLVAQQLASQIYGYYTGFVYLTPLAGGYLADRILGQRKTVVVGGVLMAIGHFLMAIESMFLLALFFLILGNGCFKPNISTQVGNLYPAGDTRRDGAFAIFYMGVNLGAFLSPLVCGTLGQLYGWHYGFGAAGVGMVFGLLVYLWGQKFLAPDQLMKDSAAHKEIGPLTPKEWRAIWGLCALCALNIVFWAVYEQQGNTMQIFADESVNWNILGWTMPSTWFQSLNPLFIFAFVPLLTMFWGWQAKRKTEPSSVTKMAIGCFVLGIAFVVLIYACGGLQVGQKISFLWLVLATLMYTVGEIYLSPIGLSLVTKVAPARLVGLLMGMWFLSSFFGNILSGYIGGYYTTMSKEGFFTVLMVLGVAAGLAMFALNKPLRRAIGHGL